MKKEISLTELMQDVESGKLKTSGWNFPKGSLITCDVNRKNLYKFETAEFTSYFIKVDKATNEEGKEIVLNQVKINGDCAIVLSKAKKDSVQLTFISTEWTFEGKTGLKAQVHSIKE